MNMFFDFLDMTSEIMAFFKAAAEDLENAFSPHPKKRKPHLWHDDKRIRRSRESYELDWDGMPLSYWQDLVRQQLKEKEELDKKIIEDYEARHRTVGKEEPEDSAEDEESNEDVSGEEQTADSEGVANGEPAPAESDDSIGSYENSVSEPVLDGSDAFNGNSNGDTGSDSESEV